MSKSLSDFFQNVMLMSGTPANYQRIATKHNLSNVCSCPPKMAMENKWICTPKMNLVECSASNWPNAVKSVLHESIRRCTGTGFRPTILVNCKSIDEVDDLKKNEWFAARVGKEFHFIAIHSDKGVDHDGNVVEMTCSVDNDLSMSKDDVFEYINGLDDTERHPDKFKDDLPVIVAQVQMLGEGINVCSFNAVLTGTNSEKTAMQQIGRALRNYKKTMKKVVKEVVMEVRDQPKQIEKVVPKAGWLNKLLGKTEVVIEETLEKVEVPVEHVYEQTYEVSKMDAGLADVYLVYDNKEALLRLVRNLSEYDLTNDCFDWGRKIDVLNGGAPEVIDMAEHAKKASGCWEAIDPEHDVLITILDTEFKYAQLERQCEKEWRKGVDNDGNGIDDIDEFKEKVLEWDKDKLLSLFTGHKCPTFKKLKNIANDIDMLHEMKRDFFNKMHEALMRSPNMRRLWDMGQDKLAMQYALGGNEDIAAFFSKCLSASSKKAIRGKMKA